MKKLLEIDIDDGKDPPRRVLLSVNIADGFEISEKDSNRIKKELMPMVRWIMSKMKYTEEDEWHF